VVPACVNVSRRQVSQALMIALVIVMSDEGRDVRFEIAGQEVILQQDAVPESLVPMLDIVLCLGPLSRLLRNRLPGSR